VEKSEIDRRGLYCMVICDMNEDYDQATLLFHCCIRDFV
jgi:hypothetical protein